MIKDSIVFIGISQALFAAIVLGTRRKVTVSDLILIGCLLAITLRFLAKMSLELSEGYLFTNLSVGIIPLTFGPFLYLYTKYLTRGNPPFEISDWLHFLPFFIFLFVSSIAFGGQISYNEVTFFVNDGFLWIRAIFGLVFFSSVLIYTLFTFFMLRDYRKSIKLNLIDSGSEKTLFWLNFVSFLFSSLFLSYIVIGGINAVTFSAKYDLDLISNLGLIAMVYSVSYFGIKQPSIFDNIYSNNAGGMGDENMVTYGKPKYNMDDLDETVEKLKICMEEQKPYLQADLSLSELAAMLNISKSDLTYLLNNHMGVNFFSYVNNYRLQAVIKKLEDPKNNHLTILSIAYDCGFNSKSTFNGLFKQHTGMTPTQYKQTETTRSST